MLRISPYVLIQVFFIIAGIISTIWGWVLITKARRSKTWPSVEAEIVSSKRGLVQNDLLPEIVFNYAVEGRGYTKTQEFPSDLTPDKEFTDSFLKKYPAGARVQAYYNPYDPEQATLETGFISGNWMVFALGIGMTLFGALSLIFSG
jgi:hypothetical protein